MVCLKTNLLDYTELDNLLKGYDIDGVFHLSGKTLDKLAVNLDENDIADVMDIKVKGIQNLGRIFDKNRTHRYL